MTYQDFSQKIEALVRRVGGNLSARVFEDTEKHIYTAEFSDGTIITGNSKNIAVTVKFRDGNHMAMATV